MRLFHILSPEFVGNKAKVRISKRAFQENKARQIFLKRNFSYPLIRTLIRLKMYFIFRDTEPKDTKCYSMFLLSFSFYL